MDSLPFAHFANMYAFFLRFGFKEREHEERLAQQRDSYEHQLNEKSAELQRIRAKVERSLQHTISWRAEVLCEVKRCTCPHSLCNHDTDCSSTAHRWSSV